VGQFAETAQLLQDYARQELREPLGNTWRWIGYGLAGAAAIGFATGFLVMGLLRMMQTEWPETFDGRWMRLVPYFCGLVFAALVIFLALRRINKNPLTKTASLTKEER
jgi:FtsH-binding integral membrane protein